MTHLMCGVNLNDLVYQFSLKDTPQPSRKSGSVANVNFSSNESCAGIRSISCAIRQERAMWANSLERRVIYYSQQSV
jgi:hypothetical protein